VTDSSGGRPARIARPIHHTTKAIRVGRRRHWLPYLAMALGLLVVACSKAPTGPALLSKIDPCGGLTVADAAAILKIPVKDLRGPRSNRIFSCSYGSRSRRLLTLNFSIYVEASPAKAQRALDALRQSLAVLSPIIVVDQLGDEAYRAPDPRVGQLLLRKGSVWVDIVTPSNGASQRRIARIVSAHLP